MKVLISEIEEEGLELDFNEVLEQPGMLRSEGPVGGHLYLHRHLTEITIEGDISASIWLQCSRCLEMFLTSVKLDVSLTYLPVESLTDEVHEIKNDEAELGFYKNNELDITSIVQEQIILNLPMKPLCDPDCKGLCPKCGANLNIESCRCIKEEVDPRWSALKKLLS